VRALSWPFSEVVDAACDGLAQLADQLDLEQSPRGVDALDEVRLHPALADGLTRRGFGCHREQRYPFDRARRKKSEGKRCDLVVTPDGLPLDAADPRQPSLFPGTDEVAGGCPLGGALWIEVKTVAQFGEAGPNAGWTRALTRPAWQDVEKLARDRDLRLRAMLLILFTKDSETAVHDLSVWADLGRARGFALGDPVLRGQPVADRFGNQRMTTALFPIAG
jgi:hypothetical protein